jgi:hypothetical protein
VTTDLDTLLTALYVLVDDHVIKPGPRRPGHPERLSDAELVCLAVAQVLLGARSEITGCGSATAGWVTCSRTCRTSRAITSASRQLRR